MSLYLLEIHMELFTDKTGDVKTASKNRKGVRVCGNSWNRKNLKLLLNLGNGFTGLTIQFSMIFEIL